MTRNEINNTNTSSIDTAIVLFLLTLELGRSAGNSSVETLLLTISALMVMALPLAVNAFESSEVGGWLLKRAGIAVVGIGFGLILPTSMEFVPMTLLIPAAMISIYIQFYSLFRLRLAK